MMMTAMKCYSRGISGEIFITLRLTNPDISEPYESVETQKVSFVSCEVFHLLFQKFRF